MSSPPSQSQTATSGNLRLATQALIAFVFVMSSMVTLPTLASQNVADHDRRLDRRNLDTTNLTARLGAAAGAMLAPIHIEGGVIQITLSDHQWASTAQCLRRTTLHGLPSSNFRRSTFI